MSIIQANRGQQFKQRLAERPLPAAPPGGDWGIPKPAEALQHGTGETRHLWAPFDVEEQQLHSSGPLWGRAHGSLTGEGRNAGG